MKVILVESDIVWGDTDVNLNKNAETLSGLQAMGVMERKDLVLLPECFSTGYAMSPELIEHEEGNRSLEWMKRMAVKYGIAIYSSLPVNCAGRHYNRGYFIFPDGSVGGVYDKRHLFMGDEAEFYTAGVSMSCVDYYGWKFALNICYDLRFPVWGRNRKFDDGRHYDVMLNVSNWPTSRLDVSGVLVKGRAMENQAYLFFCNRTGADPLTTYSGGSAAIDPKGRSIGENFDVHGVNCIAAQLDRLWIDSFREYFPVLEDADSFTLNVK